MPKFHVSCSVTVDVVMTVEAEEHSKVHHIVKDKLIMNPYLVDTDASKYEVVETNINKLEGLTVTKE